jgi:hypothetical protein
MNRGSTGGGHDARGGQFEAYSILFYYLKRRIEFKSQLEPIIQPSEGEDAKFIYTIESRGKTQIIEELIQCKKTETPNSSIPDPVVPSMNKWVANRYYPYMLKKWLEENHKANSSANILTKKENTYYTALLFGEVTPFFSYFIPPILRLGDVSAAPIDGHHWYPGSLFEKFPPKFRHEKFSEQLKEDLRAAKFKSNEGILRKVRLVFLPEPLALKNACRRILEEPPYHIPDSRSPNVVKQLLDEIEKRTNYVIPESDRPPLRGVFDSIIEFAKLGRGGWLAANEFLDRGEAGYDLNKEQLPRWEDFKSGRYVDRPEFSEAAEALERDRFVVVHSRHQFGTGKTTLCRFLAYEFLRRDSGRKVFYLPARAVQSLDEEVEFFRAHIKDNALFIIDDEDFLHDEVNRLVEEFWKIRSTRSTQAMLVISTTNASAYTIAQAYVAKPDASDLHQAAQITLRPDAPEMSRILTELNTRGLLESPPSISAPDLASLSDGSLALAVAVCRCAQELKDSLDVGAMLNDRSLLGRALTRWILLRLNRRGDDAYFREEVAVVFIVASLGLPVPESFKAARELRESLFLYDAAEGPNGQIVLRGVNLNTASVLSAYYKDRRVQAVSAYLKEYREYLPLVCKCLMQQKEGDLLQKVLEACSQEIVETLDAPDKYPISINGVGVILRAFYKVYGEGGGGKEGAALKLARCQNIRGVGQGFPDFMLKRALDSAHSLRNYLEAALPVNKRFMRAVIAKEYLDEYKPRIIGLLEDDACPLDEIAAALRILKKYSPDFAENLYKHLIHSDAFGKKVAKADDERALFIWVRFCENLRAVNRAASYEYLEAHLQEDKVLEAVRSSERFNFIAPLLLRLRLLQPRLATGIITRLWEEDPQALVSMFRKEEEVLALCEGFKALSKLNRRVAVRVTNELRDRLVYLLGKETRHRKAGSALERLSKYTSLKLTQSVAQAIDREALLESLRREDVLDIAGKMLYSLSEIDLSLAAWFTERLDYSGYLRSSYVKYLRQLVYLVRGFLRAAHGKEAQQELLNKLVKDATLRRAFREAWDQRADLSEMAVCLALLLDVPIGRGALLELLEFTNDAGENFEYALDEFGKNFAGKFEEEHSVLHVASALFGAAKLDPGLADGILGGYVARVEAEAPPPRQAEPSVRRRRSRSAPDHPRKDYKPANLVDVGRVLQIAAAINPESALRLAQRINLEEFARYEAAEEQNLGRLAVFIWGLNESSRALALDFLRRICTEERWREQYKDNEELENVLHYAHSLRHVSRTTANEFMRFVVVNHYEDIQQSLANEVNLMTVSNWLRALSSREQSVVNDEVNSIIGSLEETAEFDTQLYHLIEATEALIECGQRKAARRFAARALSESSQLRSLRKLQNWIVLFHKALRIESKLGIANFTSDLFEEVNNLRFFTGLLSLNNQPLLDSYVVYLLRHTSVAEMPAFKALGEGITGSRKVMIDMAKLEPRKALRILLSLILAKSPLEEIHKFVAFTNEHLGPDESGALYEPWESGLIALVFHAQFPEEEVLLADPLKDYIPTWQQIIVQHLNEHARNLEYGLTLYLAKQVGISDEVLAEFYGAIEERAEGEVNSAVSALLRSYNLGLDLRQKPYSMWSLLKDSVLRSVYLPWESDIEDAQDSPTFTQASVRKIDVILPY